VQLVAPVVDLQLLMQRLSYSQPFIVTGAASATLEDEAMLTRREAESLVVNMLDDGIMIDDDYDSIRFGIL